MKTLISVRNIIKEFPGVKALDDISFDIRAGEVHVLLGENGAGKSTLMKILSGVYYPTSGEIIIEEKTYSHLYPKESLNLGISIIYQELSLIDELSIMENMFVGKLPTMKKFGVPVVDYKFMLDRTSRALATIGLDRDPKEIVENLSISEKQQCEIAKAIISESKVIIMDEPTTSLTIAETENLFGIIRKLKKDGKGIVYISHKMEEIKQIGDRVTVLKDGKNVGTESVETCTVDGLIKMMVGRELYGSYLNTASVQITDGNVIFEARNISRKDKKAINVSFKLYGNEIIGFFGLIGSGRSELMKSIFGAEPRTSGKVFIHGKEKIIKSPYDSIRNGLAMVTEDRRDTGFLHNFDIKQNISITPFIKTSKLQGVFGLLDFYMERKKAETEKQMLKIKCSSIDEPVTELSGGNQQKVILGKWLAADSEILIFDEPTKGIDVGSKSEIYLLMRKLSGAGKGVIMVSSDLNELLSICDRICVYRDGRIQSEFSRAEATKEKILRVATGE